MARTRCDGPDAGVATRGPNSIRSVSESEIERLWREARAALDDEDLPLARSRYFRLTEVDGTNPRSWINYGAICGELEDGAEAEDAFARALEIEPASREALSNLGVLKREAGDLARAESCFRRVVSLDPAFVFGHYNLAHTLFLAGRFAESAQAYRAGLKLDPGKTANQNARLAWALLANGEDKAARRELRRALERTSAAETEALVAEAGEVLDAIDAALPARERETAQARALVAGWARDPRRAR